MRAKLSLALFIILFFVILGLLVYNPWQQQAALSTQAVWPPPYATPNATFIARVAEHGLQPAGWVQGPDGVVHRNMICECGTDGGYVGAVPCNDDVLAIVPTVLPITVNEYCAGEDVVIGLGTATFVYAQGPTSTPVTPTETPALPTITPWPTQVIAFTVRVTGENINLNQGLYIRDTGPSLYNADRVIFALVSCDYHPEVSCANKPLYVYDVREVPWTLLHPKDAGTWGNVVCPWWEQCGGDFWIPMCLDDGREFVDWCDDR